MMSKNNRLAGKHKSFTFSECEIPIGSVIIYVKDPCIKPIVIDDRHIQWENKTTSLSTLAKELKGVSYPVQGPLWFSYNDEILADRRLRLEKEKKK